MRVGSTSGSQKSGDTLVHNVCVYDALGVGVFVKSASGG